MTDERKTAERIATEHFEQGWTRLQLAEAIEQALVEMAQRHARERNEVNG